MAAALALFKETGDPKYVFDLIAKANLIGTNPPTGSEVRSMTQESFW